MTPKGNVLEGVYDSSFCTIRLDPSDPGADLAGHIATILIRLQPHRETLRTFVDDGGELSFFIGWFVDGNVGATLGVELLKALADLRISLELDVYGGMGEGAET
ncbi:MAG TPA: hypothetical protein VMC10_14105 [Stellaceae bacterium]|nr:hypothetical protein [Stellaceae bacterium]HUN44999.1 hypothetical protein [Stellaceae bacterium]